MKIKTEIGKIDGVEYTLRYGRMCDINPYYERKTLRWFLWIGDQFCGDFETKANAIHELQHIC